MLNIKHFINKCFRFDKKKFVKYSRALVTEGKDRLLSQISLCTHIVEKGLTMPEMRQGFGQENILKLMMLCNTWKQSYDITDPFFFQAVQTILEYNELHQKINYKFTEPFRSELESFVNDNNNIAASKQPLFDGFSQFFSKNEEAFPIFSSSRHTIRHFSNEDVPLQTLSDAIELAQNAPSSCNRQTARVHIVTNKTDIADILALQNGNRGFGHLVNKLLIITYDSSCYGSVKERHLGYIDSGIFIMNLLYALHYYRIGACSLNWCDSPKEDSKLRSIIPIKESETIVLFIACGMVPNIPFPVAKSHKNDGKYITTVH